MSVVWNREWEMVWKKSKTLCNAEGGFRAGSPGTSALIEIATVVIVRVAVETPQIACTPFD